MLRKIVSSTCFVASKRQGYVLPQQLFHGLPISTLCFLECNNNCFRATIQQKYFEVGFEKKQRQRHNNNINNMNMSYHMENRISITCKGGIDIAPTLTQRYCYSSTKRYNNVSSKHVNRQRCMEINKAIVKCRDTGDYKLLKNIIRKNIEYFNDVNVATSFSVLAKLKTNSGIKHINKDLISMLIVEMDDLSEYDARELVNITWSLVKLAHPLPNQLVTRYSKISQDELKRFKPQALSNSLWAFATSNEPLPNPLVTRFSKISQDELETFTPQELSNSIWALVISGLPVPDEFSRCLINLDFTCFSLYAKRQLWTAWLYSTYVCNNTLVNKELGNKIHSELSGNVLFHNKNNVTLTKTQKEIYNVLKDNFQPKHIEMEKCIQQTLLVDIFLKDEKYGDILIEVDGSIHQTSVKKKVTDKYKMEILNGMGYTNIIRLTNAEWDEVRNDPNNQVDLLKKKFRLL